MSDTPAPPPTPPAVVAADETAATSRVILRRPGLFGDVFVLEEDGLRLLRFGHIEAADQSAIDPAAPEKLIFEYIRLTTIGPALRTDGRPLRRALAIGLGGGAWPRLLLTTQRRVHIDAIEIDPVVVDIARSHFALPDSPRLSVIVDDAAHYVVRPDVMTSRYDLILLDAFSGDAMPDALSTPAFFLALKRILADDGVLMVNVALVSQHHADAIVARIAAMFPGCSQVRARHDENQLVFAGKRPLPPDTVSLAIARASVAVGFDVGRDVASIDACPATVPAVVAP